MSKFKTFGDLGQKYEMGSIVSHVGISLNSGGLERRGRAMADFSSTASPESSPTQQRFEMSIPLMTREAFAKAIGLPLGVLVAQAERGYWPQITVGRRVFINVEAVRVLAAARAQEAVL